MKQRWLKRKWWMNNGRTSLPVTISWFPSAWNLSCGGCDGRWKERWFSLRSLVPGVKKKKHVVLSLGLQKWFSSRMDVPLSGSLFIYDCTWGTFSRKLTKPNGWIFLECKSCRRYTYSKIDSILEIFNQNIVYINFHKVPEIPSKLVE